MSSDPSDLELCSLIVVLNFDLVSNLHLASATTQLHTMVADIESMHEMASCTPGDPESHWHDRFGSLRLSFPYARSRHVPRSLPAAFVIIVIFLFRGVGRMEIRIFCTVYYKAYSIVNRVANHSNAGSVIGHASAAPR